jgi:tetratricopeptide (TPR) repeat protein
LRKVTSIDPRDLHARIDLGEYLRRDGQADVAITVLRDVINKAPENEAAWINLGTSQLSAGRLKEAEAAFVAAFRINPGNPAFADRLRTLAWRHLRDKSFDHAAAIAARAILFAPGDYQGWLDLALCDDARGGTHEMVARMARVALLAPGDPHHDYWRHLALPAILSSRDDITYWRNRYRVGLETLGNRPGKIPDPSRLLHSGYFFLAYHGLNDRSLIEELGKLLREKVPALEHIAPHVKSWLPPPPNGRRIRLAIISNFLHGHTIGKLYQGLIRHLDQSVFEITLIRPAGAAVDHKSAELDSLVSNVVPCPLI